MINEILRQDVPVPGSLVESVLRQTGVAHLASLHPSPIGEVVVVRAGDAVTAVVPEIHADEMLELYEARTGVPAYSEERAPSDWSDRIDDALATGRGSRVKVALSGVSQFQRDVLMATARIPVGETRPYAWIARESRHDTAVRAVGTALGRNPIPLIIPCHRVVRSDGSLGQYAFGPEMKAQLLAAEHSTPRLDAALVGARRGEVACYPTCRHARRLQDPVGFTSIVSARQAGYRPCKDCRPV